MVRNCTLVDSGSDAGGTWNLDAAHGGLDGLPLFQGLEQPYVLTQVDATTMSLAQRLGAGAVMATLWPVSSCSEVPMAATRMRPMRLTTTRRRAIHIRSCPTR